MINSPLYLLCLDMDSSHLPVGGSHPPSTRAVKVAFLRHKCEVVTPYFTLSDGFHCSHEERQVLTQPRAATVHCTCLPMVSLPHSALLMEPWWLQAAFSPSIVPCPSLPQGLCTTCVFCQESSYFPYSLSLIYLLLILQILGHFVIEFFSMD